MKFLRDLGFTPKKRIRLILGLDEETANRGIERYFEKEPMPDAGFSPDAEFPVIHGEKGLFSFDFVGKARPGKLVYFVSGDRYNVVPAEATAVIDESLDLKDDFEAYLKEHGLKGNVQGSTYTLEGKSAHASTPEKGVNGAAHLATFLSNHIDHPYINVIAEIFAFDHYGEKTGIASSDEQLKALTLNAAVFKYSKEGALIGVNIRYPGSFDLEKEYHTLSKLAYKYGLAYESKGHVPPHYVDPEDPLVTTLMDAYQTVTKDYDHPPFTIGGGTYARTLEKGVAFGLVMPGREDVAHQVDEHIFIDDLIKATAIYMEAIENLSKLEEPLK
ncbi:MAG: Sapep family Mn(2+)-dependent dipeptidase, partial [Bacillota bacterium]